MYEMRRSNPKPTLFPTHKICNLPNHIERNWPDSYMQWLKTKLAEAMAWGIKQPTFKLGIQFDQKVRYY